MRKFVTLFLLLIFAFLANVVEVTAQTTTLISQNFNNLTAGVPTGWNNSDYDCYPSYIWQSDANGYNGTRGLKFNTYSASNGSYSTLKTPVLNLNVPYVLKFKYSNYNAGDLQVFISLDGGTTYPTALTGPLTTGAQGEWDEMEVSLSPYLGQSNVKIVFKGISNCGYQYQYLDDIIIESAPLCKSPTGLFVTNLATTSADLVWGYTIDGSLPGTVQLKVVDEQGNIVINDNAVPGLQGYYTMTGLSANTTYTVSMRSDCTDSLSGYSKYATFSFTTACNPLTIPYTENFDALNDIPDCASAVNGTIESSIKHGTTGKSLKLTSDVNNVARIIFPLIRHASDDIEMRFYARSSVSDLPYTVGIVTDISDPEGTFEGLFYDTIKTSGAWSEYRMNTSTTNFPDTTVFMSIFLGTGASVSNLYIDDVTIHAIPTCVRPEQFKASNATASTVDLSWTTSTSSQHIIDVINPSGNVSYLIATTNPYTVTGLQPNSQYQFRLRALCSASDTSEYASATPTAKTLCMPLATAVWTEGAETTTGTALPDCWTYGFFNRTGTSSYDEPFVSQTSTIHTGSRAFSLRDMSSGNISYMSSNGFTVDQANKYQASIWVYRPSGTSYVGEGLRLFASNSPDDVTNAQELGFINRYAGNAPAETGSGWFKYSYPIAMTGVVYLVIQGESKYGSATNFDDISVELAPTCFPSGDITLGAPTMNDIVVSWTAGASNETSWVIAYELKQGTTVVATDSLVVTQPTYTITNLTSASSYNVNVRVYAMCTPTDIASAKSFSGSFTTPCASITSFPYLQDFESLPTSQTPNCWDISGSTTSSKSYPDRVWGVYAYNSNQMLRMYNYLVQNGSALINTPTLNFPANPAVELQFDYSNRANCGDLYVKISTDGGQSFTDLNSYGTTSTTNSSDPGTFTTANIDLAAYAGQSVIVQFYSVANYGSGSMYIDNVLFRLQPSCRDLPTPTVVNVLPTSATVMIADTASMWDISYGPQGTAAGSGTIINVNDTNAYTLTGLTNNTNYVVYVRRVCGIEFGQWTAVPVTFYTECADLSATYSDINARSFKVTTNALEWDISYGPLGTQAGSGTVQSVSGSLDYTVTGLNPSTSYVFYVRRICGYEFSDWSYSYTVTTTSVPDSIPFATGFENDADNTAWTIVNGTNATNHFIFGTASAAVASGSKALYITNGTSAYAYNTSSATKTYAYRTIYFGSGVHNVSFQWKCTGGESSFDFGRVMLVPASEPITGGTGSGYSSTTFPNFVEAFDPEGKNYMNLATGDASGWNQYTTDIDMTGREGTYNFVVMWNDDSSVGTSQYPISIDNIRISKITCVKPAVLSSATTATGTTINVGTQCATEWEIVVSTTPIDVFGTVTGNIYQQISSAPAVITNLTPNTAFYYTARVICAPGDTSAWADPQSGRTSCNAYNVPYSEDFEDTGALACWPSFGNQIPTRSTAKKFAGNASCNISDGTAVSPELNVTTLAPYMLTGMCYSTTDSAIFYVGVMVDPEDVSTFEIIGSVTVPAANTWIEFTTYFTLLTDPDYVDFVNARHFAITAGADANIYVDNLYLGPTPSCPKPTQVLITNVLANTFDMAWTENGSATSWRINAVPATAGQPTIDTIVTNNPVTISGLNASSSYSIKISSICSATDTSLVTECGSITTACDIVTAPYSENFEAMTAGAIPNCWDNSASTTSASSADYKWGVYENGGNKMIRMHNYWCNGGVCIIESPFINLTGNPNGFELKFDYCHQASCDPFTIEITNDGGVSWTTLGTYSSNSSASGYTTPSTWSTATVNLYAYNGNTVKIRFNSSPDYSSGAIFIDNIRMNALLNCSDPQGLQVAPSETTATVQITDIVPSHTQWQYVYGLAGFDPTAATPVMTTTANFTLTGLTSTTAYEIYVRTYCDAAEQSNWVQASFSTTAAPATLPYICHFDDATENAEWLFSTNTSTTTNHFTIGTDANARQSGENGALYVTNGSGYTYTTSSASSSAAAYRLFYFHASQFTVSFSWKCTGGESSYDYGRFYLVPAREPVYLPSPGSYSSSGWPTDMIALDGGTKVNKTTSPVWNDVEMTIDMSSRPGSYYLVFIWSNDASAGTANYPLAINNIQISEVSCPSPGNIQVPEATVTQTSAVVNFTDNTAGAATINYWINTTGNRTDVLQSGVATTSPFTINGLSPSTTYYLFMQSQCSATDLSPVATATFSTACGVVSTFPFTEGFESTQFAPNCWTSTPSTSGMTWARYTTSYSSSSYIHSGSASAYLSNNSYDGESCLLATPTIQFDGTRDYNLSFYMYRTTSSYYTDVVNVYLSDSANSVTNATLLNTIAVGGASASGNQEVAFDLPTGTNGNKYIIFEGVYNYYGYVYIDDITVDAYATCRALAGAPTVESTTATTMTVSAVKDANHIGVLFAYAPSTAATIADTIGSVFSATGTATITGLTNGTTYKVYARGICAGNDSSAWTMFSSGTTMASDCFEPQNLRIVGLVGATSATLTWGGAPEAIGYEWKLGTGSTTTITTDTVVLQSLTPKTSYTFSVRALCSGSTTAWVSVSFTTSAVSGTLPYVCDFEDQTEANQWELLGSSQTNYFMVGTATSNGGSTSLYITNNNTANTYSNGSASVSFATRFFQLPAGNYTYSYDWNANGESSYDYGRAFIVPSNTTLTPGTLPTGVGTTGTPTGWISLDEDAKLNQATQWQHVAGSFIIQTAGNYMIVFLWRNDGSVGDNPPIAFDNVHITKLVSAPAILDTICNNTPYVGYGFNIDASDMVVGINQFQRIKTGAAGAPDTVITVNINMLPPIQTLIYDTLCQGSPLVWGGVTISHPSSRAYVQTGFVSVNGCDSSVVLYLTVVPTTRNVTDTICRGDVYNTYPFTGRNLTDPGFYQSINSTRYGCMDTTNLNLVVIETRDTTYHSMCGGDSYQWHGQIYSNAGTYYWNGAGAHGCPRNEVLILSVLQGDSVFSVSFCKGGQILVVDTVITKAGNYVISRYDYRIGCQVTYRFTVTEDPIKAGTATDYACQDHPYPGYGIIVNDTTIIQTGLRDWTGQCDSMSTTTIHVIPTVVGVTEEASIAEGGYYIWHDQSYNQSGYYRDTIPSEITGCDSICILKLTVGGVEPVGVENVQMLNISLVPNPVNAGQTSFIYGNFTNVKSVEVLNSFGQVIDTFVPETYPIEVQSINASGIYYVRVTTEDEKVAVQKLIVK